MNDFRVFQDAVREGLSGPFFGVDHHCFKIGEHIFEAIEDESDGYRSCLGAVELVLPTANRKLIFFPNPIDVVTMREANADQVIPVDSWDRDGADYFQAVAADGHVWLQFGTANTTDYYPSFRFEYYPRPPKL